MKSFFKEYKMPHLNVFAQMAMGSTILITCIGVGLDVYLDSQFLSQISYGKEHSNACF